MKWQRCPRCNSNRVTEVYSRTGCIGFIFILFISYFITFMIVQTFTGVFEFNKASFAIIVIVALALLVIKKILTTRLFCKDCEVRFKPPKH